MGSTRRARVLAIDDHEENLQRLATILGKEAIEVTTADSGVEALEMVEELAPDLILLDVLMPEMGGLELCQRFKKMPKIADVPVLFLSVASDTETIVKGFEVGAVDYLPKPFKIAELVSRVWIHLDLKRSRDTLAEMVQQREELISMLAHDLKNPLSSVQLSGKMLEERAHGFEPTEQQLIKVAVDATNDTMTIIESFLEDLKTSSSGVQLQIEDLDLPNLIQRVVGRNLTKAQAKSIALNFLNEDVEWPAVQVKGDEKALERVMDNLIGNAIKFSDANTRVSCQIKDGEIRVRDEGPGLSEEDQANLYREFTRLTPQPTGGETSTGLGLSIVKQLVEKMEGEIDCESSVGQGTCFVVRLPRVASAS